MALIINELNEIIEVTVSTDSIVSTVTKLSVIDIQAIGPQGPPGPIGPQGQGGGIVFAQTSPAASWIVQHNLGRIVLAAVYVAGEIVFPDIIYTNSNTLTIVFSSPQIGEVVYS